MTDPDDTSGGLTDRFGGSGSPLGALPVRYKLMTAFLSLVVLMAIVGASGVYAVSEVSGQADRIVDKEAENRNAATTMKLESQTERAALYAALDGEEGAREEFDAAERSFDTVYADRIVWDILSPNERAMLEGIEERHERTTTLAREAMAAREAGDTERMNRKLSAYDGEQAQLETQLDNFEGVTKTGMAQTVTATERTQRIATLLTVVLTLVGMVGAVVVGWRVGGGISTEVARVRDMSERIAAGDLSFETGETDRGDEIGDMVRAFGSMKASLTTVRDQARALADQSFDDPALEEDVPGSFGESIERMADDVEVAHRELASLNGSLEATAEAYSETMDRAAEGDLTRRVDVDTDHEAMAEVGEAFNRMLDDIETVVASIDAFTDDVAQSSQLASASAEEIEAASQQVTESIQEIAAGVDQQDDNLRQVNEEMQNLSGSVEEIASSVDQVAATAQRASDRGQSGRAAAADAIEEMGAIQDTAERSVTEVEALAGEIERIGEITELIDDIAEQTNILALNASIEAARAGEAGEGFAVVADEIKGLAEEVSEATDDIDGVVTDVQASTGDAVEDMRVLGQRVADGTDTIEDALDALDAVSETVEETNRGIQEITAATDDQAASTEEVVVMVDEVASYANQAATETQNVSAVTEEQTSSLGDITGQIEALADSATELQELADTFTVREGAADAAAVEGSEATDLGVTGAGDD
jgi:methyl-accepting chemotaxis protein